ncbi:MAG TPA: LuxR C-terminal-related transcriptional regulator, partial [Acidimicrobiales bacterium]
HGPGAADIEVITAFAAALLAFVKEDRASLRRHLYYAVRPASLPPGGDYSTGPAAGVLALVCQVDGDDGETAGSAEDVHFMARAYFRYAQAVTAGRAGDHERSLALVAEGDGVLGDHGWLRHLGRRLVAEAALADGWGDPVAWLREALSFFDEQGEERIASACRSLLRKAGAPVPRRRDEATVPSTLRTLGVSSRELEVLRLLGQGLANKEIGARLYLSPRTVERHVANLTVKTGVGRRSELVAFAARTVGDIPPV